VRVVNAEDVISCRVTGGTCRELPSWKQDVRKPSRSRARFRGNWAFLVEELPEHHQQDDRPGVRIRERVGLHAQKARMQNSIRTHGYVMALPLATRDSRTS